MPRMLPIAAILSVLGQILSSSPHLISAMGRFLLWKSSYFFGIGYFILCKGELLFSSVELVEVRVYFDLYAPYFLKSTF